VLATGPQQRLRRTLHFGALQQVLAAGAQQAGAAGAHAAGAEQPQQPFFMNNAWASFASNMDRVITATTMAANAANLRLIFFLPRNFGLQYADLIVDHRWKHVPPSSAQLEVPNRAELLPSQFPQGTIPLSVKTA
jgi:hypothetical protein